MIEREEVSPIGALLLTPAREMVPRWKGRNRGLEKNYYFGESDELMEIYVGWDGSKVGFCVCLKGAEWHTSNMCHRR